MLGNGEALFLHVGSIFEHVWLHEGAAGGDAANHARELQRSGGDSALARGHGNHFALIPLAVLDALDPCWRGHQATLLGRKVNPGLVSEAEVAGIIIETINSKAQAHVVKEDIAGLQNGLVKVRDAVRLWAFLGVVNIAVILPAEE